MKMLSVATTALMIAIIGLGIILRTVNLSNVPMRSPDEKIYTYQANVIAAQGIAGFRAILREHALKPELWIYPPPIRIGYTYLLAAVMKAANDFTANAGARISYVFSIISLLLLIAISLRFFNVWVCLYALLFMAVSPIELAIARRTWQDSLIGCLGAGLVYFASQIIKDTGRRSWYILFTVTGAYCMLVKESGLAVYGLCILWLAWVFFVSERSFAKGVFLMVLSTIGIAAGAAILVFAAGGITPILDVIRHWKQSVPTNQYAIEYQSGPWYYFLEGFWISSPLSSSLFIIGVIGSVLPKGIASKIFSPANMPESRIVFGIIFFSLALITMAIAAPYFQNLRYVSAVFVPFYLIAGLGFWYLILLVNSVIKESVFYVFIAMIALALAFAAIHDYSTFKKIFIRTGCLDTSIRMIREYSR